MVRAKTTNEAIVDFIITWQDEKGFPPTIREIARGLNVDSPSTISGRLGQLREEGKVTSLPGHTRTLRVVRR